MWPVLPSIDITSSVEVVTKIVSPITSGNDSIRYWSGPRPVLHASPSSPTFSVLISSWVAQRVLSVSRPAAGQSSISGAEAVDLAPSDSVEVVPEEEDEEDEDDPPPQAASAIAAIRTAKPR